MFGKFCFLLLFVFTVPFAVPEEVETPGKKFSPQAILVAAYRGDAAMVSEILADSPDKDVRDAFGATALHVAMFQPSLAVVKLLLDYGFDPNAVAARNGYTPLHNAVSANNVNAAKLLVQYGAKKNIKGLDGLTPLDKARKEEKRELVLLLYR